MKRLATRAPIPPADGAATAAALNAVLGGGWAAGVSVRVRVRVRARVRVRVGVGAWP